MDVLVVGSGGREHAIAWKLRQELYGRDKLYVAPGNAGTASIAENVPIQADDVKALAAFAREKKVNITFVGPEKPLTLGIDEAFKQEGRRIVGPSGKAAKLEGSKVFSHEFMERHGIPHPPSRVADNPRGAWELGLQLLKSYGVGVIKADGLAQGKGVSIYRTEKDLKNAVSALMVDKRFGRAGDRVLLQQYMEGREASFIGFTKNGIFVPFPPAQDYKQLNGKMTGGMGAYAPRFLDRETRQRVMSEIIFPTLEGMESEGRPFSGVLYAGLMIKDGQPMVVEYNCRKGDPEEQVQGPLLGSGLLELGYACAEGGLDRVKPLWLPKYAVNVVLATAGYPDDEYKNHLGKEIFGLDRDDVIVFHAGTSRSPDGRVVSSGGRVVSVTALGDNLPQAAKKAYGAIGEENDGIYFDDMLYSRGIGPNAN
ncbi:MAG: phosphoribosylamine--glycine ligase [Candidatus Aenigmarchaeota archaeon]|nr:phosphoribosylamine--glycine ligase [Candidatus Aenigmarchaeota archaeon]